MAYTSGDEIQVQPSTGAQYLLFDVSGLSWGLPLSYVSEIVPMCELVRPPALPAVLEGFLNLRGQHTPVIRIDRLFGLAAVQFQLHTHLVVVRRHRPFVLLADRVRDVIAPGAGAILEIPREHVFGDCLDAVVQVDSCAINLLNLDRLLLKEEETRICELLRTAERRLAEIEKASP